MKDLPVPEGENKPDIAEAMKHAKKYRDVVNPLNRLPDYVKDPKNYMKIQKALLETLSCGKAHGDPHQMMVCAKCTENLRERNKLMQKFGFTSTAVYMAWRKAQEEIRRLTPQVDWEKGKMIKVK